LHSLKTRLLGLWVLSLLASLAVGVLLLQLSRQTTEAQVGRAEAVVARGCELIGDRYAFYVADWSGPLPPLASLHADLTAAVAIALAHQRGVEGGIWQAEAGSLAYAFPTYPGSHPKTDLPEAEHAQIASVNARAAEDEQPVERDTVSATQTLLLHACPLGGPISGMTAWTMTRVPAARDIGPLQLGLGVLLLLLVAMAAWLGRTLLVWGRHMQGIETALAQAGPGGMPTLAATGEQELDRVIAALNEAGRRLAEARGESDALARRVARAERLAALGRVAAGVAHEIRNPIAAFRLQGENALAGDDARRRVAIGDMLQQIDRLDALVAELLAMTQRARPEPVSLDLSAFLAAAAGRHADAAATRRLTLDVPAAPGTATLDPAVVGRILDNLLANAIRHAPEGGTVTLAAARDNGVLRISVADDGAGVPPDMATRLFEPFVTGRADGTGLGLAIARELADAHGGRLRHAGAQPGGAGAVFVLELPQEGAWPPS
jgi:hypothetical protein